MPSTSTTSPTGVTVKKSKPPRPARRNSASTTRFGAVAMSVSMPLMSPAKLSGMSSCRGETPVRAAMLRATGMKIATTPVELMIEPSSATASINSTINMRRSLPARAASQSPSLYVTPVCERPAPTTNSAPMSTTFGSANPSSVSSTLMMPVSGSATITSTATTSIRGRPSANSTTATASSTSTMTRSRFMRHLFSAPCAGRHVCQGIGVGGADGVAAPVPNSPTPYFVSTS